MNDYIPPAPTTMHGREPTHTTVLDTHWLPATDEDLIRQHQELMDKFHHADDATPAELAWRVKEARRYIRRKYRRVRTESRRLTSFVQWFLTSSVLFFTWAVVLALLAG